jgi:hypothetical protein
MGGGTCLHAWDYESHPLHGVVNYNANTRIWDTAREYDRRTFCPISSLLSRVSEETVRRNIGSKRLKAIRRGTQRVVPRSKILTILKPAGSARPP